MANVDQRNNINISHPAGIGVEQFWPGTGGSGRGVGKPSNEVKKPPKTLMPPEYIEINKYLLSKVVKKPGDLIELGCYKGGSLYRMAEYLRDNFNERMTGKTFWGLDTFTGHPEIDEQVYDDRHYVGRFSDTSYEQVRSDMSEFDFVRIHKGQCRDVLERFDSDKQFCFAHIDLDLSESYKYSIRYLFPRMVSGSAMVLDEYQGYRHREFVDDFFKNEDVRMEERPDFRGKKGYGLIVVKN
jgi:hypothetical protein